ncbi:hypothetical protein Bhyg_14067 [Pseudolycoriella hygida]|uniref:Uncharacterized protein n=1 Tax=Pseudolycoriella hygida TaxID=35572 RepID=A0A9Q0MPB6_9DIPT|nr:hypothetical protein Bhyg_14067 [Pseudolycoriella hygida]
MSRPTERVRFYGNSESSKKALSKYHWHDSEKPTTF